MGDICTSYLWIVGPHTTRSLKAPFEIVKSCDLYPPPNLKFEILLDSHDQR